MTTNNGHVSSPLAVRGATLKFGGVTALDDVSISVADDELLAIIGPNGAGKTTLVKIIMGEMAPDEGKVELGLKLEPLVIDQKRETLHPDWTLKDAMTDGRGDQVVQPSMTRSMRHSRPSVRARRLRVVRRTELKRSQLGRTSARIGFTLLIRRDDWLARQRPGQAGTHQRPNRILHRPILK